MRTSTPSGASTARRGDGEGTPPEKPKPVKKPKAKKRARKPAAAPPPTIVVGAPRASCRRGDEVGRPRRGDVGEVIPAKKVRGPPAAGDARACRRRRRPNRRSSANQSRLLHHRDWVASGAHVQHSNGLRGVVTKSGGAGFTDVTTKTGYVATVHRQDLTKITRRRLVAMHSAPVPITAPRHLQAQMDGAICAVYEGREFGNCFATKTGRPQRMFTVESNGGVRWCAAWTAPERASTAMQNDLSTWKRLFPSLKTHCGQTPSSLSKPAVKRHVERVLAMAAEPSKPPGVATIDTDDGETPEPRRPRLRRRGARRCMRCCVRCAAASDAVVPAKKRGGRRNAGCPGAAAATASDCGRAGSSSAQRQTADAPRRGDVRGVVTPYWPWVTVLDGGYEVKSRPAHGWRPRR